jgi:hypothetical protein
MLRLQPPLWMGEVPPGERERLNPWGKKRAGSRVARTMASIK